MPVAETAPEPPQAAPAAAKMGAMFRQKLSGQEAKPVVPAPTPAAAKIQDPNTKIQTPTKDAPVVEEPKKLSKEDNIQRLNEAFDKFRGESETKIKELEAQRAREWEELASELTTTKSELQKKQEFLEQFHLEHDPRFKAAFDEKISESVSLAKRAAGKELAAKVDAIFRMPPGEWRDHAFKELRGEVEDELDRSRLIKAYDALEETQAAREKELSKPRENLAKLKQLDEQNSTLKRVEEKRMREAIFADVLAKGEQAFPDLKLIEGNDEHNARVHEDRQRLKDFITGDLSPADMGNLSLYAIKGMRALQTDQVKDQLIAQLQAQVQKLTAAQPSVTGTGRKPEPTGAGKKDAAQVVSRYHQAMAAGGVPE